MASPTYKVRAEYKRHIVDSIELNFALPYNAASKTAIMCSNIITQTVGQGSTPAFSGPQTAAMAKRLWNDIRLGLLSKIIDCALLPVADPTLAFVVPGSPDTDPCGV